MILADKVAIVTGGASGIGRATVERFLSEGAYVVIADLNATRGPAVIEEIGSPRAAFIQTDIADQHSAQECVDRTLEQFGKLDILVNNAARLIRPEQNDISALDNGRAFFEVNAFGTFNMIEAAAPALARNEQGGRIVNVSSEAAYLLSGMNGQSTEPGPKPNVAGEGLASQLAMYGWSKHAVIFLTKFAAMNLGPWGINVNCVCPGSTGTEAFFATLTEDDLQKSAATRPIRIPGRSSHQAGVIAFLCGEDAALITGQVMLVEGGGKMPG